MKRLFHDRFFWAHVSCTDPRCLEIFKRHYSYNLLRKNVPQFVGPGEEITLLSTDGKALFVWRKEKFRKDEQDGINCAIFRNEGGEKSSLLILEAEEIAWRRWPGERLFTFVNSEKVRSENPGYCFKMAGWKICGKSKKRKLIILEKFKSTIMATPTVTAETNISDKKTRKPRAVKEKTLSNYDQILSAASGLTAKEKALLSLDMKKQAAQENERSLVEAKEVSDLIEKI